MKIIHKITKKEAIEAYRELNKIKEEIVVEIEDSTSQLIFTPNTWTAPSPVPTPNIPYTPGYINC